jgi:glycosyltransferase involved in cell wall biosynthesis
LKKQGDTLIKIVHICLAGVGLTDGWSYQENLLTKFHRLLGYEVTIITSQWIRHKSGKLIKTVKSNYINENDCKIYRLVIKNGLKSSYRFKRYKGVYNVLEKEEPDILFIHNIQFLDIILIVKYIKAYPTVKVFVDSHTDFSNSATNWFSKNVLHKIIWRRCAQIIEPYTTKFYGVLPARVDFLIDMYKIPKGKVELLVMGMDDESVFLVKNEITMQAIREKYHIKPEEFLIMTGGKIDVAKRQTLPLMEAVKQMNRNDVKLIVFGSVSEDLKEELYSLCDNDRIRYIGWLDKKDAYEHFASSDLVVFPGRHSVFWEQVAGLGIPMLVKYWEGTTHVDVGGNCQFLYKDTVNEIREKIETILNNREMYENMKKVAEEEGIKKFSYLRIAKQSVESY